MVMIAPGERHADLTGPCRWRCSAFQRELPKSITNHRQVVQNLVHRRRRRGENPSGIKEMEREFEPRFPLQDSF